MRVVVVRLLSCIVTDICSSEDRMPSGLPADVRQPRVGLHQAGGHYLVGIGRKGPRRPLLHEARPLASYSTLRVGPRRHGPVYQGRLQGCHGALRVVPPAVDSPIRRRGDNDGGRSVLHNPPWPHVGKRPFAASPRACQGEAREGVDMHLSAPSRYLRTAIVSKSVRCAVFDPQQF